MTIKFKKYGTDRQQGDRTLKSIRHFEYCQLKKKLTKMGKQ